MLMELKAFLTERPCASLSQIARHLAAEPEAVRPMLDRWIEKGRVQRSTGPRCQGCASCGEADLEFYAWIDGAAGHETAGNASTSSGRCA